GRRGGVVAGGGGGLPVPRGLLGVLRKRPGDDPAAALAPVPDLAQLGALIEEVRSAGLATTLEVRGQVPEVPAGVQLTVYRLVQEALTNTLKHGGPGARAPVRLAHVPRELRGDIDHAEPPPPPPPPAPPIARAAGRGGGARAGTRARLRPCGGGVRAAPRQPGGWHVAARLRLDGGDAG